MPLGYTMLTMAIYYIDPEKGNNENDACSVASPGKDWKNLKLFPGDTVLFRRGCVIRGSIDSPAGAEGAPITWGAYGEGDVPQFRGSVSLADPSGWKETEPNIWMWDRPLPSEPGNLIFDGTSCGTLRWTREELENPGDWWDSGFGKTEQLHQKRDPNDRLYLCCRKNPALCWKEMEAALYADRVLAKAPAHVVFRDLAFWGSGVHGFAAAEAEDITIENCTFSFIGGMVWNKDLKIRFGNGAEFWNGARHILIQNCVFRDIYDSCFTHQGSMPFPAPEDVTFTGCICERYGMAAYEVRDIMPCHTVFSKNICRDAGVGFAMQGETLPRRSEIWPQPMGHHLFIWRIEHATPNGEIRVEENQFEAAPNGSTLYSIVSPAAEEQFRFSGNRVTPVTAQSFYWKGAYRQVLDFEPGSWITSQEGLEWQK